MDRLILEHFVVFRSYVHWGLHNPQDDVYNFEGIADLEDVIEAAIEAELFVILRPGPYICAGLSTLVPKTESNFLSAQNLIMVDTRTGCTPNFPA